MVRPVQGQVQRYVPGQVPGEASSLARFLSEELERIRQVIDSVQDGQIDVTTVAPAKPRDGMIRRADGVAWNPGAGAGFYGYHSGAWNKLG